MKFPRAETTYNGDPIHRDHDYGDKTTRRRRPSAIQLLSISLVLVTIFSAYTAYRVDGVVRNQFPGSGQLFSVQAAYQFSSPTSQGVLVAGSFVNVTLTILSIAAGPTSIKLQFNSTNPTEWSFPTLQGNPDTFAGTSNLYTMTVGTSIIAPINAPVPAQWSTLAQLNPAEYSSVTPQAYFAQVTVAPGMNTYHATLTASLSVIPESFTLFWFAEQ